MRGLLIFRRWNIHLFGETYQFGDQIHAHLIHSPVAVNLDGLSHVAELGKQSDTPSFQGM